MRIALVTEEFVPSPSPAAHVARQVVVGLTRAGHDVVVFAGGRGHASFHGARVFWASRMTPVSAVREAMALSRPDVCHVVDPHRVAAKAVEAADRLGIPVVHAHPAHWAPGVDLEDHHPGLRDQSLHDRWARAQSPDGGQLVAGYVGTLDRRKVVARLAKVARLPGVRLVALGDGPGAETLRDAGAKVVGHATGLERDRCLATFDVLVQPRKKQVYAPVVLEALASGVPVVAYDTGMAGLVVRHEHNGLLVPADKGGSAVARAVARVAASPDLRFTLAARARDSLEGRTWDEAVGELVERWYLPALGSARQGGERTAGSPAAP